MKWFCISCSTEIEQYRINLKATRAENSEIRMKNIALEKAMEEIKTDLENKFEKFKEDITKEIQSDLDIFKKNNDTLVDLFENVEIKIKEMKKQIYNELSNEVENMIKDTKIRSNAAEVKVKDVIEENKKLIQKVNIMEEKMHSNSRPVENVNLPEQQNQIVVLEEMKKNINEQVEQGINEKLKEEKIRKDRENNFVIYNLPESNREFGGDREEEDTEHVSYIIYNGIQVGEYQITKTIRLGKRDLSKNTPRPLLVKMLNPMQKWNIVKSAKNLKYAEAKYRNIGIMPDLDINERKKSKELYKELQEKKANGQQGWYISRGKLQFNQRFQE